jgi:hypothetical protein
VDGADAGQFSISRTKLRVVIIEIHGSSAAVMRDGAKFGDAPVTVLEPP